MKSLTFQECQKYLEAIKVKTIFVDVNGIEAKDKLEHEDLNDKALLVQNGQHNVITLATDEGLVGFSFTEDALEKKEVIASLETYYQNSYKFSLFQLDTSLLLYFLETEEQFLTMIHEEIDFELGFRLRKTYLEDIQTIFVVFSWAKGPILLCSQSNGQETFQIANFPNMDNPKPTLQTLKEQWGQIPCSMKLLRKIPSDALEDAPPLVDDFEEEDILVVEMELPSAKRRETQRIENKTSDVQEIAVADHEESVPKTESPANTTTPERQAEDEESKRSKLQEFRKSLEDSVVICEDELPQIGPEDTELLNKYGIMFVGKDGNQQDEAALDEKIPLETKEVKILQKYGINVQNNEEITYREIREALEESVVLTEEELPTVKPEDQFVLEKYGIVLQKQSVSESPAPSLHINDVEVLQKYGLKLPHGDKSSLRMIQQSFQMAVAVKRLSNNISAKDRAIFAKYGLNLPQKPFYQRIPITYVAIAVLLVFTMLFTSLIRSWQQKKRDINFCKSQIDKMEKYRDQLQKQVTALQRLGQEIGKKYGAKPTELQLRGHALTQLDGVQQYIKKIQTEIDTAEGYLEQKELETSVGLLEEDKVAAMLQPNWVEQGRELELALQRTIDTCEDVLRKERQIYEDCLKTGESIRQVIAEITEKYPSQKGYPEPDPKILQKLSHMEENNLDQCVKTMDHFKQQLADGNIFWKVSPEQTSLFTETQQQLLRLHKRVNHTLNTARSMYERSTNEKRIRHVLNTLRDHGTALSQKVKSIEEAMETLQEKYPPDRGFPSPPADTGKIVEKNKVRIEKLNDAYQKIYKAFLNDKIVDALKLIEPYSQLGKVDISELEDAQEDIGKSISTSEKIVYKKDLRRQGLQLLQEFDQIIEQLRAELYEIDKNKQKLAAFPQELNIPRPDKEAAVFLEDAAKRLENLQNSIQKAKELLEREDQIQEGVVFLKALEKSPFTVCLLELKSTKENIEDAIRIARSSEKESKQTQEIARLLRSSKESLVRLIGLNKIVSQHQNSLNEYPKNQGFPSPKTSSKVYQKADELERFLQGTVKQTEMFIEKKQLEQALKLLSSQKDSVEQANAIIPQVEKACAELESILDECKKLAEEKKNLTAISASTNRIKAYLKDLEQLLQPLSSSISELNRDFSPQEGYPTIPASAQKAVDKGNEVTQQLQQILAQVANAEQNKDFNAAYSHLNTVQSRRMLNRDIITEVSKYRYEIDDVLYEARAMKKNKMIVVQIKTLLEELQQRYDGLQKTIPEYTNVLNTMEDKYPEKDGFEGVDKNAREILQTCKEELELLVKVIADGEESFHSGEYDKSVEILNPFSQKVTPGLSRLPALQSMYRQLQITLEKNRELASDKTKLQGKRDIEERKKKLREQAEKSLGFWYKTLQGDIQEYKKMYPKITAAIHGPGTDMMFNKSKVNMAELERMPSEVADLEEMLYEIEQKGGKIDAMLEQRKDQVMTQSQQREIRLLHQYLNNHKIEIKISDELNLLRTTLPRIDKSAEIGNQDELKEELKNMVKVFTKIKDKYDAEYRPLQAVLMNLKASLSEK